MWMLLKRTINSLVLNNLSRYYTLTYSTVNPKKHAISVQAEGGEGKELDNSQFWGQIYASGCVYLCELSKRRTTSHTRIFVFYYYYYSIIILVLFMFKCERKNVLRTSPKMKIR